MPDPARAGDSKASGLAGDVVTLYTALGGGWQVDQASQPAATLAAALPIIPPPADGMEARN